MEKQFYGHDEKGGIYRIVNIRNGKFYIGSARNFRKRAYQHVSSLRNQRHINKHLQASWNKYGEEAFLFEVVEVVEGTIPKIREVEQKYIDKFWGHPNLLNHKKNVTKTQGPWSSTPEETKRKLSEAAKKLHCDPVFKEKHKAAAKRNAKKIAKKLAKTYKFVSPDGIVTTITNLTEFCRNHPELNSRSMHNVWNQKMGSHRGWSKYNPSRNWRKQNKTVYQFNLNGNLLRRWNSVSEAARALGCSAPLIHLAASGKTGSAKDFLWSYDESIDFDKIKRSYKGCRKPVYQFDLNGNLLRRWNSVSEAASAVGLKSHTNISDCARGKTQTACNFIWKFDDGPIDQEKLKIKKRGGTPKKVYQFDLQGNLIKEWSSAKEAAEKTGCAGSNISLCANGKLRTCGGFVWKFDDRRIVQKKLKIKKKRGTPKKVYQFDLQGNLIKEWRSVKEAAIELGCHRSAISACARGQTQTSGNFVWKFDDKQIDLEKLKIKKKGRPPKKVYQFDLQGNLIKEWRSASEAARKLGCDSSAISLCARGTYRTAAGYVWSYEPTPPKQGS